jgi:phosphohistidine phosphatase
MLTVWLARHGEAVHPDECDSDFHRGLTDFGRRQVSALATWLASRSETPELFLHSPLLRAKQTAETIAEAVGASPSCVRAETRLSPGINPEDLLKALAATSAERILCVCHQPDVSRCLAEFISGGHFQYTPGTIAQIQFSGPIIRGGGYLSWLADPEWFA